jgi:hypothetical protein
MAGGAGVGLSACSESRIFLEEKYYANEKEDM